MIRQLFGIVAIVLFAVATLITAPTPVNAVEFNQDQSTLQSNQTAQKDQYAEPEQYVQGNRYSQEKQIFSAQDSEYGYSKHQSIQSNKPYEQTQEQKLSQND